MYMYVDKDMPEALLIGLRKKSVIWKYIKKLLKLKVFV